MKTKSRLTFDAIRKSKAKNKSKIKTEPVKNNFPELKTMLNKKKY